MSKLKVVELFIENSKRTSKWDQLIAKCEDGSEWAIRGFYSFGIPENSLELINESEEGKGE